MEEVLYRVVSVRPCVHACAMAIVCPSPLCAMPLAPPPASKDLGQTAYFMAHNRCSSAPPLRLTPNDIHYHTSLFGWYEVCNAWGSRASL